MMQMLRLARPKAIPYVLWGLLILFLISAVNGELAALDHISTFNNQFGRTPFGDPSGAIRAALICNIWVLLAAVSLTLLRINPFHWIGMTRMALGSFGVAMLLGWPAGILVSPLLAQAAEWGLPGIIAYGLAPPILLLLAGAFTMFAILSVIATLLGLFVFLPVMVFNQILQMDLMMHRARQDMGGLSSYIIRFAYWLTGRKLPKPPPNDAKGARLATPEEVEALRRVEGMGFGHVSGRALLIHTEKHVLIQASTRSGKGVALIIPHLLRYEGSAFVLDPKGENARATGRQRALLNDQVHYLDPFGISGKPRSRFNPLARFTASNMEAESKALAAALVIGERDHWMASAQQLLAAVILYVHTDPDIPPDKKDLVTVRRLLLGAMKMVLPAMAKSEAADGLLASLAQSFINTPEREFGSILSTAQRETEILDNPYIAACLSAAGEGEEVDFAQWHTGTMTVYLCLSAPKFPVFNRWLRLVLTAALDEMTDRLRPPPKPVCFLLDELATLGHLNAVENAIGLAAGYGVQLVTVFQDVAQMRDLYKGRWASFIGNAGVRALFNLDDYDTAEYWSKFIGGRLVESRSHQEDHYGLTRGSNIGEHMRPLLSPEEIMRLFAVHGMLVLTQGAHPIVSARVPYYTDASLAGLWDDPREADQEDRNAA